MRQKPELFPIPERESAPEPATDLHDFALSSCETVAHEAVHSPSPSPENETREARAGRRREWLLWALLICTTGYAASQHVARTRSAGVEAAAPTSTAIGPVLQSAPEAAPQAEPPTASPEPTAREAQPVEIASSPPAVEVTAEPPIEPAAPIAHIPIRILSNVEDAAIHADGRLLGVTGQTLLFEPHQRIQLTLSTPRHQPRSITLDTGDGTAEHADYFVALEAMPAFVQVEARAPFDFKSPRRAEILVDQVSVGEVQLPYIVELPEARSVRIGLRAAGFLDAQEMVLEPEPGSTAIAQFELEHLKTVLRLTTTPTDAKVWLGAQEVDPAHIPVTPGLLHAIRVTAEGYRPVMRDIVLEPGETREMEVALRPYTYFQIVTDPPEASLFMDGRRLTERRVRVRPDHVYAIDARAPGYHPFRAQYEAAEGTTEEVHIRMRRRLLPF